MRIRIEDVPPGWAGLQMVLGKLNTLGKYVQGGHIENRPLLLEIIGGDKNDLDRLQEAGLKVTPLEDISTPGRRGRNKKSI